MRKEGVGKERREQKEGERGLEEEREGRREEKEGGKRRKEGREGRRGEKEGGERRNMHEIKFLVHLKSAVS